MNPLARWMDAATPAQQRALAKRADTTLGTLRQVAGGYRTKGKARTTAELAIKIERAAKTIFNVRKTPKARVKLHRVELPPLHREHLSPACAGCEFAKQCRKS